MTTSNYLQVGPPICAAANGYAASTPSAPAGGSDDMPEYVAAPLRDARKVVEELRATGFDETAIMRGNPMDYPVVWLADDRDRLQAALDKAERERDEITESHAELFVERSALREGLFFFASVIKSGESWSASCDAAMAEATKPWHERAVHPIPDSESVL